MREGLTTCKIEGKTRWVCDKASLSSAAYNNVHRSVLKKKVAICYFFGPFHSMLRPL